MVTIERGGFILHFEVIQLPLHPDRGCAQYDVTPVTSKGTRIHNGNTYRVWGDGEAWSDGLFCMCSGFDREYHHGCKHTDAIAEYLRAVDND